MASHLFLTFLQYPSFSNRHRCLSKLEFKTHRKVKTKSMVRLINGEMGYSVPEIIRPDEVL